MMKRSRLLSATPQKVNKLQQLSVESSESEFEGTMARAASMMQASGGEGGTMRRNRSAGGLQVQPMLKPGMAGASMSESRRAGPDEVVVRNRSNTEIRALLFRSTDYSFMV